MTERKSKKVRDFNHRVYRHFRLCGYEVLPGKLEGSPVDFLCFGNGHVVLVNCRPKGRVTKDEKIKFVEWCRRAGAKGTFVRQKDEKLILSGAL